jgi:serine protease Do
VVGEGRVVTLARNLRGNEVTVAFSDGRRERARALGSDADLGATLLEVATGDSPLVAWAGDSSPDIGTPVFALADPAGRGLRVTAGAVSSAPRSLRGPRGRLLHGLIEHTAPLPPGSGGGPLLDSAGELLGLNAVRLAHGLILALPAAGIRARLQELSAGRSQLPEREGVLVRGVEQDSPADRAGVERGDLIVTLHGRDIDSLDALFGALDSAPLKEPLSLRIVRGVAEREVQVSLEPR